MTRAPTLAEIDVVEMRVLEGKRNVRQSVDRTRSAFHTVITRPSTVVMVVVAAGLSVFWVARQRRPAIESLRVGAGTAARATRLGVVWKFISRYETPVVAYVLHQLTAAWQKPTSRVNPSLAKVPTAPDAVVAHNHGPVAGPGGIG